MKTTKQSNSPWVPIWRGAYPILLAMLVLTWSMVGAGAQGTSSVTVGASTVTYTDDWELLGEIGETAFLEHAQRPYTLFEYSVYPDNAMGTGDPAELITVTRIELLESMDVVTNIRLAGGGSLADGTVWRLYTIEIDGTPVFYLAAANADLVPGADVVSAVTTSMADLVAAHFTIGQQITVDDAPTLIARIEVVTALALEAVMAMDDDERLPMPPPGPQPGSSGPVGSLEPATHPARTPAVANLLNPADAAREPIAHDKVGHPDTPGRH